MERRLWVQIVPAFALIVGLVAAARGQESPSTAEKIKEKVGAAAGTVKKGVVNAGDALKARFQQAKGAVVAMEIEARVYARLHWDKTLATAKVELRAPRPGAIELIGVVPDAAARDKAVALTTDTIGVTEVIDRLTVQTTATTDAPGPNP